MPSKKQTISVRLDDAAKRQVDRAAKFLKQSAGAFLEKAGEGHARSVLLAWAADRHRRGQASFSELAEEPGLAVEEIMLAAGGEEQREPSSAGRYRLLSPGTHPAFYWAPGERSGRNLSLATQQLCGIDGARLIDFLPRQPEGFGVS